MYYINYVKKEFYNINRDVLVSKNIDILPFNYNKMNESFYFNENNPSYNEVLYYNNKDKKFDINL